MAVKTKKKSEKKERKEFKFTAKNQNDFKAVIFGDGDEKGDYISYFTLIIINGLQISGSLKLSTNEDKDSFFSFPSYKKEINGKIEYIQQISIKDDGLKEDLDEFIEFLEEKIS